MTFPNDKWRVYTGPHRDLKNIPWRRPTTDKSPYGVLKAIVHGTGSNLQIMIDPATTDISLDDYIVVAVGGLETLLGLAKKEIGLNIEVVDSRVIQREGRRMGVMIYKVMNLKFLMITFKERARFTTLRFGCFEELFESKKDQFWAIVDSYEYLEKETKISSNQTILGEITNVVGSYGSVKRTSNFKVSEGMTLDVYDNQYLIDSNISKDFSAIVIEVTKSKIVIRISENYVNRKLKIGQLVLIPNK